MPDEIRIDLRPIKRIYQMIRRRIQIRIKRIKLWYHVKYNKHSLSFVPDIWLDEYWVPNNWGFYRVTLPGLGQPYVGLEYCRICKQERKK